VTSDESAGDDDGMDEVEEEEDDFDFISSTDPRIEVAVRQPNMLTNC
jgi:hypothetical protein